MKIMIIWLSIFILAPASQWQSHYPYESDTILTAWLIKTYVDKEATFKSFPKEHALQKTYAINTPNSLFRRNARFTAYEMAKRHFHISDTCSNTLVKIIKVLEMMPWKKHEFTKITNFEEGFVPLFPKTVGEVNLTNVFTYINHFCKEQ